MMRKIWVSLLLLLWVSGAQAGDSIYKASKKAPAQEVYQALYKALEEQRLWVVFEPDMGRNIAGMAKRLGDDYNRNGLQTMRSMVVCNAWYANKVSNLDPDMLALCPLRVGVIHKDGVTTLLFARPTVHAQGSPALTVITEIEDLVITAIQSVVK